MSLTDDPTSIIDDVRRHLRVEDNPKLTSIVSTSALATTVINCPKLVEITTPRAHTAYLSDLPALRRLTVGYGGPVPSAPDLHERVFEILMADTKKFALTRAFLITRAAWNDMTSEAIRASNTETAAALICMASHPERGVPRMTFRDVPDLIRDCRRWARG